jgi:hypothetical protein
MIRTKTVALILAAAALACSGVAAAQSCADRATRLKTEIEALPSTSTARTRLAESLGIAMGSDSVRCGEILSEVEQELAAASREVASAEKAAAGNPTSPAGQAKAPVADAEPRGANDDRLPAANEPIPGELARNTAPAASANNSGPVPKALDEQGEMAYAAGDDPISAPVDEDPIPRAADADDGEAIPED